MVMPAWIFMSPYSAFPERRGRWRCLKNSRVTSTGSRSSSASRNTRRSFTIAARGFHEKTLVFPTKRLTRRPAASNRLSCRWMALCDTSKVVAIRRACPRRSSAGTRAFVTGYYSWPFTETSHTGCSCTRCRSEYARNCHSPAYRDADEDQEPGVALDERDDMGIGSRRSCSANPIESQAEIRSPWRDTISRRRPLSFRSATRASPDAG